jgi:hypothetical protein
MVTLPGPGVGIREIKRKLETVAAIEKRQARMAASRMRLFMICSGRAGHQWTVHRGLRDRIRGELTMAEQMVIRMAAGIPRMGVTTNVSATPRINHEIRRITVMTKPILSAAIAVCAISFGIAAFSPAQALTMSECSAKYKAAKDAGSLNGTKWNDFRKAECGTDAAAAAGATAADPTPAAAAPVAAEGAAPATPVGNAVFPSGLSPQFSTQKPAQQRMHTCLEQYKANKASNANGGLRWIQKGGGYYSECNKHLKGTG